MTTTDIKPLAPRFLTHTAEYDYKNYFLRLPPEYSYDDVFRPGFWAHHGQKLHKYDLIRIVDTAGSFDCLMTVVALRLGEPVLALYAGVPPQTAIAQRKVAA
jgi:hypothetical protein